MVRRRVNEITGRKLLEMAEKKVERKRVSLYVETDVYDAFLARCEKEKRVPSRVLELLLHQFMDSLGPRPKD